jgi:hypothetical protein
MPGGEKAGLPPVGTNEGQIVNFVKNPNNLTDFLAYGSFLPNLIQPGASRTRPSSAWCGGGTVKSTIAAATP